MIVISVPTSWRSGFRHHRDQHPEMIAISIGVFGGVIRSAQAAFFGEPMPTERMPMRMREILRLPTTRGCRRGRLHAGLAWAARVSVMLRRFRAPDLSWLLPEGVTDAALELKLYGVAATRQRQRDRAEPDWSAMNRDLGRIDIQLLDTKIAVFPPSSRT